MNKHHSDRKSDVLESRRLELSSRDTLLPWADPYIANLQRTDSPAAKWPDRPHADRQPNRNTGRRAVTIRGEVPPPLNEFPLSPGDHGGR